MVDLGPLQKAGRKLRKAKDAERKARIDLEDALNLKSEARVEYHHAVAALEQLAEESEEHPELFNPEPGDLGYVEPASERTDEWVL